MSDEDSNSSGTGATSSAAGEVPPGLKPLEVVAKGYKYYLDYLKGGGSSRISSLLGYAGDILPEAMKKRQEEEIPLPDLPAPPEKDDPLPETPGSGVEITLPPPPPSETTSSITQQLEIFASESMLETGILQTALSQARRAWVQAKLASRDPLELVEAFSKEMEQLDRQYHESGLLNSGFTLIGFVHDSQSGSEHLLIASGLPDGQSQVFKVDPAGAFAYGPFRLHRQGWRIALANES